MKTCQLWDTCRWWPYAGERSRVELLVAKAAERDEWRTIGERYQAQIDAPHDPDHGVWASELPEDYVIAVLGALDRRFYLNADGTELQGWYPMPGWDREMSALEAYQRYGGLALARASENGARLDELR